MQALIVPVHLFLVRNEAREGGTIFDVVRPTDAAVFITVSRGLVVAGVMYPVCVAYVVQP